MRNLVVTDGGAPDVDQRAQLREAAQEKPFKLAVITNSLSNPVKRGIATALRWFNPAFMAVGAEKWREAFTHVDMLDQVGPLLDAMQRLQQGLPPVKTLDQLLSLARGGR